MSDKNQIHKLLLAFTQLAPAVKLVKNLSSCCKHLALLDFQAMVSRLLQRWMLQCLAQSSLSTPEQSRLTLTLSRTGSHCCFAYYEMIIMLSSVDCASDVATNQQGRAHIAPQCKHCKPIANSMMSETQLLIILNSTQDISTQRSLSSVYSVFVHQRFGIALRLARLLVLVYSVLLCPDTPVWQWAEQIGYQLVQSLGYQETITLC